jgi:prepilin-type N-terminal cleavage/methylation domain-containing protein
MRLRQYNQSHLACSEHGLTLVEMLIATVIGAIMLTIIVALTSYAQRSFAVTSSHVNLSSKSRYALDKLTRELRQATAVISCDTNLPFKTLTLTNAIDAFSLTVSWDADVKSLRLERTGPTPDDNRSEKLLGNCERWDFTLCQRAPTVGPTDVSFNPASSLADCKLILMSWTCRQEVYGKLETENVQEMQIALRNKVN